MRQSYDQLKMLKLRPNERQNSEVQIEQLHHVTVEVPHSSQTLTRRERSVEEIPKKPAKVVTIVKNTHYSIDTGEATDLKLDSMRKTKFTSPNASGRSILVSKR